MLSAKDKRFVEMDQAIKKIQDKTRINDWVVASSGTSEAPPTTLPLSSLWVLPLVAGPQVDLEVARMTSRTLISEEPPSSR